ncbi:hypothetical protein DSM104443_03960 [Usitatibacter rugosus]|uniref:Uncharacterized protein n=1 Tax=Usitatibacter rugosus TaxID=2732067 RepID=A0A6M4H077_9PROT|nr:hypothetical protein [Usitatibacter rugosus]QJR12866.1 hypothetical protein DSM104443_03960 [Usitatibacter rugosus]
MKKVIPLAVAAVLFLVAVVAGKIIGKMREPAKNNPSQVQEILRTAVTEFNKQAPMMVDAATRLDRASSAGSVLTYHYTLLQRPAPGETLEQLRANVPAFEETTKKKVCADDKLRALLGIGVTMRYAYVTTASENAFEFAVTQEACLFEPPRK